MLNKIRIIFILLLLFSFLKNQSMAQPHNKLGINMILSFSKQDITEKIKDFEGGEKNEYESEYLHGIGIGVFYEREISNTVSLGINLEYLQKGTETYIFIPNSLEGYAAKAKFYSKIDCITLPFYVNLSLVKSKFVPSILLGMNFSYAFSFDSDYLEYYYRDMNKINYGAVFGLTYELEFSNLILLKPQLRFNHDFNSVINKLNIEFNNNLVVFSLGILII